MKILHLSADYPDPLVPAKTRAVANLLALDPGLDHRVYSLNRVDWRLGIEALGFADAAGRSHRAVAYGAPPRGLMLRRFLHRLADWIEADLGGWRPDLIHAHKVTVEGLAGLRLAGRLGVPLAVSVQGNTDLKIAGARRDLKADLARVWQGAAVAFPFAPWARDGLDRLLGARTGPVHLLPCPGPGDRIIAPRAAAAPVILSAFNLATAQIKNAEALIRAAGIAGAQVPELQLEILGGGSATEFARLARLARAVAPGRVRFAGAVAHDSIQDRFNAACGYAMVSRRESFGMVFSEALLAGCPVLGPAGRGIDGWFSEADGVLAADPGDGAAIATGLVRLVREETGLKAGLARAQAGSVLPGFTRAGIRATWERGLAGALGRA